MYSCVRTKWGQCSTCKLSLQMWIEHLFIELYYNLGKVYSQCAIWRRNLAMQSVRRYRPCGSFKCKVYEGANQDTATFVHRVYHGIWAFICRAYQARRQHLSKCGTHYAKCIKAPTWCPSLSSYQGIHTSSITRCRSIHMPSILWCRRFRMQGEIRRRPLDTLIAKWLDLQGLICLWQEK